MYDQFSIIFMVLGLLPYVIISVAHLIQTYGEHDGPADLSKFLLMPALLLGYVIAVFTSTTDISWFMVAALIAAWIANILFIYEYDLQPFFFGTLAFFVMLILYQIMLAVKMQNGFAPLWLIIIVILVAVIVLVLRLVTISNALANFAFLGVINFMLLVVLMASSWIYVGMYPMTGSVLTAIGSVLLIVGAWIYSTSYFIASVIKARFLVMLSFLLGQLCIVVGLMGVVA